ncbi:hypothetical protein CFP56_014043, partial [Quercus suber]
KKDDLTSLSDLKQTLWTINELSGSIPTSNRKPSCFVRTSTLRKQTFWTNSNHYWKFDQAHHFKFVHERTKWFNSCFRRKLSCLV